MVPESTVEPIPIPTHLPSARARHERGALTQADSDKVIYRTSQYAYYREHRPAWENRFLLRRHRRSLEREEDADYRRRLRAVWEEANERLA